MAIISITIPDAALNRVITAICAQNNYQDIILGPAFTEIPNPETKAAFAKRMIINVVKDQVKSYEVRQAGLTAAATVETEIALS
jgi:hypothetical protein